MTIKLIAMDIDGTILNKQHQINPEVKTAIQKAREKGVTIALSTGRPMLGTAEQIRELALDSDNDYVISYNGSLIENIRSGQIIAEYSLAYEDYLEVEMFARKTGAHLHVIDRDTICTANRNIGKYTILEAYLLQMPLKYRTPEEMTPDMKLIKFMLVDDPPVIKKVVRELPASFRERFHAVQSTDFYFEIQHKQASKGQALKTLADYLAVPQAETMAIGDNENDISMIEYAGLGVAMGNSTERVKEIADAVVASNEENGVAEAIERYVLK